MNPSPRTVCLIFLSVICLLLFKGAHTSQVLQVHSPLYTYDFGTVKQGSKVVHKFMIPNDGNSTLTIQRVDLSVPGMTARFKREIPAGGVGEITVEWNTSALKGTVEGRGLVYLNDPEQRRLSLTLRGVVKPLLEIRPAALYFSIYKGESAEQHVSIKVHEEETVQIERLEKAGEHFSASLKAVQPGKTYDLLVKVPDSTPPGRYFEALYLYTDRGTVPRLTVAVNVLVKTDLYASPERLHFGVIRRDQLSQNPGLLSSLTETVSIRKRQGTFKIISIQSDLPLLHIVQTPSGASEIFRIDVGLVREQIRPGKISGVIGITTDDRDFPHLTIPVEGEIR